MINSNALNDAISLQFVEWISQNQERLGLGGVPVGYLTETLRAILPTLVNDYTASIYTTTNQGINQGPRELIGQINPYNTVINNSPALSIASAILNRLGMDGKLGIQTNVISGLVSGLQSNLGSFGNSVDYSLLSSSLTAFIGPFLDKVNTDVSTNFINGVLNNGFESPDYIEIQDLDFGVVTDPETDLEELDLDYTKNATNQFLTESKNFNIQEDENVEKLIATKLGFVDPTATYPTKEYAGQSEVNKLAKGEPTNSLVQAKEQNRMQAAPLPGNQSFNEPGSAYKAVYPYNKVTETESGHVIEVDDTPGAERLHVYHKAGTYIEIDRDGNMICRRKGSDYQIIDKNGYVSVAGHLNLSVAGSVNLFAGNSANVEIIGDAVLTVHNDFILQSGGNIHLSANDTISLHANNIRAEADNDYDQQVDGILRQRANVVHSISKNETYVEVGKTYNVTGNAAAAIFFAEDYTVKSDKKIKHKGKTGVQQSSSSGAVTSKSPAGGMNMDTSGFSIRSAGLLNLDATFINMQENMATPINGLDFNIDDPTRPEGAKNSFAGLLSGRKDYVAVDMKDSVSIGLADNICLTAEEQADTPEARQKLRENLIAKGLISEADLDKAPVAQTDVKSVSTSNKQVVMPSDFCLGLTEAPDGFKLSPNFTLGQLTSRSACSATPLVAQAGLSYGQILQNLQALALNVCEPVFNLYPSMYITSGFRRTGDNPTSQHPKGQAVDIQFKGIPQSDYFKIANLLAQSLNYDQLLLEYSAYTKNPWIHISFSFNSRNRNQVLTFWNNKTHTQGLVQLA